MRELRGEASKKAQHSYSTIMQWRTKKEDVTKCRSFSVEERFDTSGTASHHMGLLRTSN